MKPNAIFKVKPDSGEVLASYPSIRKAAKAEKVHRESIRLIINKLNRQCAGGNWVTADFLENLGEDSESDTSVVSSGAKILILDIETAPLEAYVWGLWKQNIFAAQLISNWYMLTWAAKWLYDGNLMSERLTPEEAVSEDDKRIVEKLWLLLDEADVVIAHNGDKFDLSRIRSRFLVHDMMPPNFYKQLDTLKVARKEFDFSRNSLDSLAEILELEGKSYTSFELWSKCKNGDPEALEEMEAYNIQDVYVLEDVYLKLRPWIKGHPNLDLYIDSPDAHCPHCGRSVLFLEEGYVYTQAVRYQMYRCSYCRAVSRGKSGVKYKNKKKISAIPR